MRRAGKRELLGGPPPGPHFHANTFHRSGPTSPPHFADLEDVGVRLLDQVSQASATVVVIDGTGRHEMPGAGAFAGAIRACGLRYVLDSHAAGICRAVAITQMPQDRTQIHMPATSVWLEWPEEDGRRTGLLVEADASGRRGLVETFWEQPESEPDRAQANVAFDLDVWRSGERCALDDKGFDPHLSLRTDACWKRHFNHCGTALGDTVLRAVAADLLPGMKMLFAFALVLSVPRVTRTTAIDRLRLNKARRHAGKPELLDHIEVQLMLDSEAQIAGHLAETRRRSLARPHQVRGHFVRRGGRIFWRRSHIRGKATGPMLSRTVQVRSMPG